MKWVGKTGGTFGGGTCQRYQALQQSVRAVEYMYIRTSLVEKTRRTTQYSPEVHAPRLGRDYFFQRVGLRPQVWLTEQSRGRMGTGREQGYNGSIHGHTKPREAIPSLQTVLIAVIGRMYLYLTAAGGVKFVEAVTH